MSRAAVALAVVVLAVACTEPVDAPPLGDYTGWARVETSGAIPGHGDSLRVTYVNDTARTGGTTAKDSVLVMEVRDDDGGSPGALREIAIMRKLVSGPGPTDEGGWLFSQADAPGGDEIRGEGCWARCHVQAPFAGVWRDYTK